MTYFLEFHTPRGVFTSTPQTKEVVQPMLEQFEKYKNSDCIGLLQCPLVGACLYMTTEMIRQTVLVIREAE